MIINCLNIRDFTEDNYNYFIERVSSARRKKAESFRHREDAYRSICAELLLAYSYREATGKILTSNMHHNEYGKPYISNCDAEFQFSLSHAGEWVAAAYGKSEVGVDVEQIQHMSDTMINGTFDVKECKYLQKLSGKLKDIYAIQIWTMKESYVKYLGTGLATEMKSFSADAVKMTVENPKGCTEKELKIQTKVINEKYLVSVCSEDTKNFFRKKNLEDILDFFY